MGNLPWPEPPAEIDTVFFWNERFTPAWLRRDYNVAGGDQWGSDWFYGSWADASRGSLDYLVPVGGVTREGRFVPVADWVSQMSLFDIDADGNWVA